MAMKIGLCFPYTQESLDRDVTLDWFRRVDEGPFSTLSCGERVIGTSVESAAPSFVTTVRSAVYTPSGRPAASTETVRPSVVPSGTTPAPGVTLTHVEGGSKTSALSEAT